MCYPNQVLKHESAMLLRIGEHPNIVGHQGFYVGSNQVSDLPLIVARTRCLTWLLAWVPTEP